jgi:hypothetical protein
MIEFEVLGGGMNAALARDFQKDAQIIPLHRIWSHTRTPRRNPAARLS